MVFTEGIAVKWHAAFFSVLGDMESVHQEPNVFKEVFGKHYIFFAEIYKKGV